MSLKGKYNFFGKLAGTEAYAIVDYIQISKGGNASYHVSVYPTAPTTTQVEQDTVVKGVMEKVIVDQVDRGPVIEHMTLQGVTITADPFEACYDALKLDPRFSSMVDG